MRVFFIGNSHTFRNGLPYQVCEMVNSAAGREECQVRMSAVDGRSLGWHAEDTDTLLDLARDRWDFVVLQQQSHPFGGYAKLAADCGKLLPHIEKSGAAALLYVTWKRKDAPEGDQDELDSSFGRLADERGLRLVPVGAAWRRARTAHPHIELYAPDGAHASPAGTYLAACVFLTVLTGKSPRGLSARITANGTTLADLPPRQAESLQRVAAEMWQGL
jgi:hypothetical protein